MSTVRLGYNDLLTWCNKNGSRGQLLIEEWNQEKNYNEYGMPIVMQEISACTTRKKYYWKCKKCRKDFLMSPACRTLQNQGCPECSHRMGGIKNHRNAIENNNDLYSWCMENGIFGKKLITEWHPESGGYPNWDYICVLMRGADKLTLAEWENHGEGNQDRTEADLLVKI